MAGKIYTPELAKQSDTLKYIGRGQDISNGKQLLEIPADIKGVIYPIGASGLQANTTEPFLRLQQASWFFRHDGTAAVQLRLRPQSPEIVTLTGKLMPSGKATRLHVENTGLYGLRIALDGILKPSKSGFQMIGFLTIYIRGITQVESIKLSLKETEDHTLVDSLTSAIQQFEEKDQLEKKILSEQKLLSEPSDSVGGVSLPMTFDVKIMATLDGNQLEPMNGQLLLQRAERIPEPTIDLSLVTSGPVIPGWSAWHTVRDKKIQTTQEDIKITAQNSRIDVSISPIGAPRQMQWFARSAQKNSDVYRIIYADKGSINLRMNGDVFSGSIMAHGFEMGANRTASTFRAELNGEKQAGAFLKQIKDYIGPLPFSGRWRDAHLGVISLHQQNQKVTGRIENKGSFSGEIHGQTVDLTWQTPGGGVKHGFLSSQRNGLLTGMLWTGDDLSNPEVVTAIQEIPQEKVTKKAEIPAPRTDAEAQELKYLGYDLYAAGKYKEATYALDKVVDYFSKKEKSAIDTGKQNEYLVNQALAIYTLINSANEAGDFQKLVDALAKAVEIQRKAGKSMGRMKDSTDVRSFQDQVKKNIDDLDEQIQSTTQLATAYSSVLQRLSNAGIGISGTGGSNTGLMIEAVQPNMPASQAGVMAGDVFTVVDGLPLAGMNPAQASSLLLGKAGTSVSIRFVRNGKTMETRIVRKPLLPIGEKRKQDVTKSLTELRNIAIQLQKSMRSESDRLKQKLSGESELHKEFDELIIGIDWREKDAKAKRLEVISLVEKGLANSSTALSLFQRFIKQMQEVKEQGGISDKATVMSLTRLDQDIEAFKANPDASMLDKTILELSGYMLITLDKIIQASGSRLKMAKSTVTFLEKDLSAPNQTAISIAGLGQWLDNWRSRMATDAAKISSLNNGEAFYISYVNTLIKMNLPEEALQASESARARAFTDLLAARRQLKDPAQPHTHGQGLFSYSSTPPLSLQEIKKIATEQQRVVVEYFLLPNHTCSTNTKAQKDCLAIWTIGPNKQSSDLKISLTQVPVDIGQLKVDVNRLVELMSYGLAKENDQLEVKRLLQRLNSILIEPLERNKLLAVDSKDNKHLTIIPHDVLFSVPFAALLDSSNRYLVEKHSLNFATALSVLKYTREAVVQTGAKKERNLLALVSPAPLPKSEEHRGQDLLPLADTATSFPTIASFYTPMETRKIFTGTQASEKNLRENAANADVLYFATHAEVKTNDPLSSFIALSQTNAHDGYLRALQITSLDLRAELVILAGCETGRGGLSSDGINGLSRAFTQAGASSLLISLWKVPEARTALLMQGFHHYWLEQKLDKAESLQKTQIKILNSSSIYRKQPNLWSAFVLYGRTH